MLGYLCKSCKVNILCLPLFDLYVARHYLLMVVVHNRVWWTYHARLYVTLKRYTTFFNSRFNCFLTFKVKVIKNLMWEVVLNHANLIKCSSDLHFKSNFQGRIICWIALSATHLSNGNIQFRILAQVLSCEQWGSYPHIFTNHPKYIQIFHITAKGAK